MALLLQLFDDLVFVNFLVTGFILVTIGVTCTVVFVIWRVSRTIVLFLRYIHSVMSRIADEAAKKID